jgi:hypothetical protein
MTYVFYKLLYLDYSLQYISDNHNFRVEDNS